MKAATDTMKRRDLWCILSFGGFLVSETKPRFELGASL
jgi:hypothetical protein